MDFPNPGPPQLLEPGPAALRAIIAGDGQGIDDAFRGLGAGDLMALHECALFLADACRVASRGRSW